LENISAAVAVGISWPQIAHKLIEELADMSFRQSGLKPSNDWVMGKLDFDINDCGTGFFIKKKHWKKILYKFVFSGKNATGFFYGIVSVGGKEMPELSEVLDNLDKNRLNKGERSDWWPWSLRFNDPYCNWNESDFPWVGIKKGNTVDVVSNALKELDQYATKAIDTIESTSQKD